MKNLMIQCPVCDDGEIAGLLTLEGIPLDAHRFADSRQEALRAPRADMHLTSCKYCGCLFNACFDPSLCSYDDGYANPLDASNTFQEYSAHLAGQLVSSLATESKSVLEVGCGNGKFLEKCRQAGATRITGYDISLPDSIKKVDSGIWHKREFSERESPGKVDLVILRHVLEHIPDPVAFISRLAGHLDLKYARFYVEVPNAHWMLESNSVWDLIYEHCSFFSPKSLTVLFERCGLRLHCVRSAYGGQFLQLLAGGEHPVHENSDNEDIAISDNLLSQFRSNALQTVSHWRNFLEGESGQNRNAAIWGAGSKGIIFGALVRRAPALKCAIDLSAVKQGKFMPVSGLPVHPPSDLSRLAIDTVLVMNPLYLREISIEVEKILPDAKILAIHDGAPDCT